MADHRVIANLELIGFDDDVCAEHDAVADPGCARPDNWVSH
jgi:hypothetical protein